MKKKSTPLILKAAAVAVLFVLAWTSAVAENVFVTSFKGTAGTSDVTPNPPCAFTGCSLFGASTASASTASPTPVVPASGRRVVYGNTNTASWSVTPTDVVLTPVAGTPNYTFRALQPNSVYKIYVTDGESGNASPDLIVNLTATGGALADTNGVAATTIPLTVFQASVTNDVWIHIGYITNTIANPTLTFTYASGTIASTGGRWYMDAIWFENLDACAGIAPEVQVGGPLAAGQTAVDVLNVAAGATNVSVYANGFVIGSTNLETGFGAGTLSVATTALVKGEIITATQIKTNLTGAACTSDPGASGMVGGGPNARLTTYLGCWSNATLAGPIGADSAAPTGNVYPYFLRSSGVVGNFGTAPGGGPELNPGECWQTITFRNGVDDAVDQNSNLHVTNTDNFCSLESLIFSIVDTDTGPYDIYVDTIMNGDTVVEDFESYPVDTTNTFATPANAASPAASSTYLGAPNSALISANYAFDGTKSLRIRWQWTTDNNIRWARTAANAPTGKRYPQLDARLPITIRYLVLPVGSTTSHKFNGSVSQITNSAPVSYRTDTNTLGVTVTGSGAYTYQWYWNGLPLLSTSPTLVLGAETAAGLDPAQNGAYRIDVSDGTCTESRSWAMIIVDPIPTITNQPASAIIVAGSTAAVMSVGADGHVAGGYPLTYLWRKDGVEIPAQNAATLSFPLGAALSDVGTYDVIVGNTFGSVTSVVAYLSITTVAPGAGTGLGGAYFDLHTNSNPFVGAPALTRDDATVDFNWGAGSPGPGIGTNWFTIRWFGQVQAVGDDTYTFYTITDDGVRLWVNGQRLVNDWTGHPASTNSQTIALTGSQKYDLVMEYYEQTGDASAKLYWSTASGSIQYQPVPKSQLLPLTFVPPTIALTSPADPSSYTLPATVNLTASVTTNNAQEVNSVGFFTNGVLLATVTSPPYSYSWVNPPVAIYNVTAKVVYDLSTSVESGKSTVTINPNPAAPVTITGIVGTNLNYTGGAGAEFVLLKSADVAAPIGVWVPAATNTATPDAFTVPVGGDGPQMFYRIQSR